MNKKIFVTGLILSITISLNAQNWWSKGEKIKGNGKITTENRKTSNFDKVATGGSFNVILVKGNEGDLILEGEENILPYIETKVERGVLKINFKKKTNIHTTKKLTITVYFEDIEAVALGGSGKIYSNEKIKSKDFSVSLGGSGDIDLIMETNSIKASIGGSGNIELKGNSDRLTCSVAGSGNVKAYELDTNEITASLAGSGNIRTTVKDKIKASLVGSGNIYYKGNPPKIESKTVGSGKIIKKS